MLNKFLPLLLILTTTTMVWGRIPRRHLDTEFVVNDPLDQWDEAPFQLGEPTYFGSGCPDGSVEVVQPDGDSSTVSVLFSDYMAETNGSRLRDRKSCNLAVPVTVEPGWSCGIFKVDYRGFTDVPRAAGRGRSSALFNAEYFFAGDRGPRKSRSFDDQDFGPFFESDSVGAFAWSPCGGSTNFRINTSLMASKPSRNDPEVLIEMDSADVTQDGFHYYFRSRRC
jgi:Domain of unknown function (DUF4360)